jgi:hypothetical protein
MPSRLAWSVGTAFALLVLLLEAKGAEPAFTYADLVGQMTDLARLAELPTPGEQCAQWSSYDRASRYDQKTGKYVNWDANNDGPQFIRKEGNCEVMAEMHGPGCIWRIWSAAAQKGHVKIYLDGNPEPALDLPFADYFDGRHSPLAYPLLSYNLQQCHSSGQNLYLPIPYQKSCKVVAERGWGRYFHFTYRTYPKGTQLPTFSTRLATDNAAVLRRVNDFLARRLGDDPAGTRPGQQVVARSLDLAPGQAMTVADLSGARAISAIRAKARFNGREDEMAALRELVLEIRWDDAVKPAVWCPLGDWFGTAPGVNRYKSLTTGMTADGFYTNWYMPFARSAQVRLLNEGSQSRQVSIEITHAPLPRPFAGLGHFHARWHRDTYELPRDRFPDWPMLRCKGRGRFCGVMLHVWNPRGGWWGEGDEKFFVDGEKFPSTIGTGSEDYFGYAWCNPHLFQRPYHAQTMTQGNRGHQSVLRWHLVDNVPFQRSFEACIEKYYTNKERGTLYACLPCFYLAPDGRDSYQPVPAAQRQGYYTVPELVAGGFKVLNVTQGDVRTQEMAHFGRGKWPRDEQLWWTGARPKAKLDLAVPVSKSGTFAVSAVLTKARDYGTVQLYLDGVKAGDAIDLYNPSVIATEPIALGTHRLDAGQHKFTVEIVGANPKAVNRYMFGLGRLDFKSR